MAKASLIAVALAGALMTAVAARADEAPVAQIDLDGELITIACPQDRVNDVWVQYARCQEIFDDAEERETAEQYCKPLAVAQACSQKSVPL